MLSLPRFRTDCFHVLCKAYLRHVHTSPISLICTNSYDRTRTTSLVQIRKIFAKSYIFCKLPIRMNSYGWPTPNQARAGGGGDIMIFCAQPYLKPCFMCPFYILSTCPSKGLCTALHLTPDLTLPVTGVNRNRTKSFEWGRTNESPCKICTNCHEIALFTPMTDCSNWLSSTAKPLVTLVNNFFKWKYTKTIWSIHLQKTVWFRWLLQLQFTAVILLESQDKPRFKFKKDFFYHKPTLTC